MKVKYRRMRRPHPKEDAITIANVFAGDATSDDVGGDEERRPLPKVEVGSGITMRLRELTLTDQPYRGRVERGALIDGRVRTSSDQAFYSLRSACRQFAEEVFTSSGLPNPFSFIHKNGKQRPQEGHILTSGGKMAIDRAHYLGYRLAADRYLPAQEDHSDLWYAAKMAITITRLETLIADADRRAESRAQLIEFGAQYGSVLATLATERGIKAEHEDDAVYGRPFREQKTTAPATQKRSAQGQQLREHMIERCRAMLRTGAGRFKSNGRINARYLARNYIGLTGRGALTDISAA